MKKMWLSLLPRYIEYLFPGWLAAYSNAGYCG